MSKLQCLPYTVVKYDAPNQAIAECVTFDAAFTLAIALYMRTSEASRKYIIDEQKFRILRGDLEVWNSRDGQTNAL